MPLYRPPGRPITSGARECDDPRIDGSTRRRQQHVMDALRVLPLLSGTTALRILQKPCRMPVESGSQAGRRAAHDQRGPIVPSLVRLTRIHAIGYYPFSRDAPPWVVEKEPSHWLERVSLIQAFRRSGCCVSWSVEPCRLIDSGTEAYT